VDEMNLKEVDNKKLYVGRAQKKAEREAELRQRAEQWKMERMTKYQGVNLYVKNLEDTVDDDRLRSEFSPFGTITSAKVMKDDQKFNCKGFGFVCFNTPEEATRAVTEMNGRMLGSKPLYVALAQRKEVRRAQLEAQHARNKGIRGGGAALAPAPLPYAGAAPMFYPQPGNIPQQGFVYPQQMMPRNRWTPPQAQYQPMPNYSMVPMGQRQQQQGQGGNRRANIGQGQVKPDTRGQAPANRSRGVPRNAREPAGQPGIQPIPQPTPDAAVPTANASPAEPFNQQILAGYSPEQQKLLLGERIYPLVHKVQPELAGKITGMLLDSHYMDEIFHFLENPEALNQQINEAVTVLEQHAHTVSSQNEQTQQTPTAQKAEAS